MRIKMALLVLVYKTHVLEIDLEQQRMVSNKILHSVTEYLEADLFIKRYGPVGERDGVAETGLPLDRFLREVHNNLGSLGIWMEKKWADGNGTADAAILDRQTPLGFVVTSM